MARADASTMPSTSVCLGALTSSVVTDGSASGAAFTGKNVMLNFRLGGIGALAMTGGDGIGGGSCTGSRGKKWNPCFLSCNGEEGAVGGVTEGEMTGSMSSSGGSRD